MASGPDLVTRDRRLTLCVLLVAIWLPLHLWSNAPGPLPGAGIAAGVQLLALIAFIAVHSALYAGWRGAGVMLVIAYAISFVLEATSINAGIPFGWFVHLAPGPKPLGVPLHVPLAYGLLGWIAWTLGCLLCRRHPAVPGGPAAWLLPVIAALIFTGYDLAYDPIGSAVKGLWIYRDPGGVFGVPLSNFIGWIVTCTAFFGVIALVERRFARHRAPATGNRLYWLLPCIIWGGIFLQYPLFLHGAPAGEVLVGGARRFLVADIYEGGLIAALLTMVPVALVGVVRALQVTPLPISPASDSTSPHRA